MTKLKKLKLNQLGMSNLEKKQMNALTGGASCGCPCYYEGTPGGSSTDSNSDANKEGGYEPGYSCYKSCWGPGQAGAIEVLMSNGDVGL